MSKTLLQKYASAAIQSLIEMVHSLSEQEHQLTKDKLSALFVSNILQTFLSGQFGVGTGVIINRQGIQSDPVDIVIFDNRLLPPFIQQQNIGVFPAESVVGIIQVISWLGKSDLLSAEESAKQLYETVYRADASACGDYAYLRPLCGVLGFYGNGMKELGDPIGGIKWVETNIHHLFGICLIDRYTWLHSEHSSHQWHITKRDGETYEETKQFLSVFIDRIRVCAEARYNRLSYRSNDWLGSYIRDVKVEKGSDDEQ
jgi:hypothetical protein